jgi:hypothetical protein
MYDVLNFFDHVGLLEQRGYLDKGDVWSEFSYWLFAFYSDARPLIDAEQKDDPASFSSFSALMDDLEVESKHAKSRILKSYLVQEAIAQFGR